MRKAGEKAVVFVPETSGDPREAFAGEEPLPADVQPPLGELRGVVPAAIFLNTTNMCAHH